MFPRNSCLSFHPIHAALMDTAEHPPAAAVLRSSSGIIKHTEESLTSLLSELGKTTVAQLIHGQVFREAWHWYCKDVLLLSPNPRCYRCWNNCSWCVSIQGKCHESIFWLNLGIHRLEYMKLHVLEGFTEVFILAVNISLEWSSQAQGSPWPLLCAVISCGFVSL